MFLLDILKEEILEYKKILIISLGFLCVIVATIAYVIWTINNPSPKGMLIVSMAQEASPVEILKYDLERDKSFNELIGYDGIDVMQFKSSVDPLTGSLKSFFVFEPVVPAEDQSDGFANIVYLENTSDKMNFILPDDNILINQRQLDYSENSRLLTFASQDYTNLFTDINIPMSVESWGIYLVDPSTQGIGWVATGFAPRWSPNGESVVFLGADGVKQYFLETQTVSRAVTPLDSETRIGTNMNMDITPDGSLAVLTSPNQFGLYFLDITSWNPLTMKVSSKRYTSSEIVNKGYYWPVFSPDGMFLAVQSVSITKEGLQENAKIEIIRLKDMKTVKEISLDGYDFSRSFIDDWVL